MAYGYALVKTNAYFWLILALSVFLLVLAYHLSVSGYSHCYLLRYNNLGERNASNYTQPTKLTNQTAIALVFYGRRQYVSILYCYLVQNLVDHGGVLSSVIFLAKTENNGDLAYLDSIVAKHPGRFFRKNTTNERFTFKDHYKSLIPDQYYFKMDDDIVYIHPNTLGLMLQTKLTHSDILFVSANIINHPVLGQVHAQMRAIHNLSGLENSTGSLHVCHWISYRCGVLQHESFLKRYKDGSLSAYMFSLWDFHYMDTAENYTRWSINLILFQGKDLIGTDLTDDEREISHAIPLREKKHCVAVGPALAVHFAYGPQRSKGLIGRTEYGLLEKYQQVANDSCHSKLGNTLA